MEYFFRSLLIAIVLIISTFQLEAQVVNDTLHEETLIINHADRQIIDLEHEEGTQFLYGDVQAYHDSSFMFCDTAILKGQQLDAFGNVVILQSDTIRVFSDSLFYNGDSMIADLIGEVILENGGKKIYTSKMTYHLDRKLAKYNNKALLKSKDAELKSQSGYYDLESGVSYFYGNVTATNPDFFLKSDSLIFMTKSERAKFIAPTIIHQGQAKIYCETGFYDIDDKLAEFSTNAQYQKEDETATADTIYYDVNMDLIRLSGDAIYQTTTDYAEADEIIYQQKEDVIILIGDAYFSNDKNNVRGEKIIYDKAKEQFITSGRSRIEDNSTILSAEDIDFNQQLGFGIAVGDVNLRDTVENGVMYCDTLLLFDNDSLQKSIAIGEFMRPQFISVDGDNDSLYVSSDTLISFQQEALIDSLTRDTIKYLVGDNDVRIYNNEFQAKSDSMSYNSRDSLFTLFGNPVVWSDSTQIIGDTVKMYLKNKKVERMEFIKNAMIISTSDLIYYNQIQGKNIYVDFSDNKIDKMKVKGNARSVYYLQDEKTKLYSGVNTTDCSLIIFNFNDSKIQNIRFYIDPKSEALPMEGTDHLALRLEGFEWNEKDRPVLGTLRNRIPNLIITDEDENIEQTN